MVSPPHPHGRNQAFSKSRRLLQLHSKHLCADTPDRAGRTTAALEMLCMRRDPASAAMPTSDMPDRGGRLSKKGHVFYGLFSDINDASISDAK